MSFDRIENGIEYRHEAVRKGQAATYGVGDVVEWSSDDYPRQKSRVIEVLARPDVPYTRCDTGTVGYWSEWGYRMVAA